MVDTAAPISEVAIANMAVSLLNEYPVTSLDNDTPIGRFMAREFGYVRDELLQKYPWHFAKKRALLNQAGDPPAFGWTYAYNLPSDCLRLLPLRKDGKLDGVPILFELESRQILTDYTNSSSALPIHYIRKETAASKFPPLFARTLGNALALLASQRVTGKQSYFQTCMAAYTMTLEEAKLADSLERGTPERVYTEEVLSVRGV